MPDPRSRRYSRPFPVLPVVLALAAGCGVGRDRHVNAVGSTSVQPFAELLAEEFQRIHPETVVDVQGGGSTAGIRAIETGIADIGMCSRNLNAEEALARAVITIARDGLSIVVHPDNPVSDLTVLQVRDIFSGQTKNWRELGGPDIEVRPITREEGSGTREAFAKLVMGRNRISDRALVQESNGAVKELVRGDPCAVGYMSLGLVGDELKMVSLAGVKPSAEAVRAGTYPLARPLLFVTSAEVSPAAREYIEFVLSDEGQRLLVSEGLVGVR